MVQVCCSGIEAQRIRRSWLTPSGRGYQFAVDTDSSPSVCPGRTAGLPCADLTNPTHFRHSTPCFRRREAVSRASALQGAHRKRESGWAQWRPFTAHRMCSSETQATRPSLRAVSGRWLADSPADALCEEPSAVRVHPQLTRPGTRTGPRQCSLILTVQRAGSACSSAAQLRRS